MYALHFDCHICNIFLVLMNKHENVFRMSFLFMFIISNHVYLPLFVSSFNDHFRPLMTDKSHYYGIIIVYILDNMLLIESVVTTP